MRTKTRPIKFMPTFSILGEQFAAPDTVQELEDIFNTIDTHAAKWDLAVDAGLPSLTRLENGEKVEEYRLKKQSKNKAHFLKMWADGLVAFE